MKTALAVILGALGIASAGRAPGPEPRPQNTAAAPCVAWMGARSLVITPHCERITTKERWEEVWHRHTGEGRKFKEAPYAIPPEVDFSKYMVIAWFTGPAKNRDGERVVAIDTVDGAVRIRFDSLTYQTASLTGEDQGVAVTPYGLWVIDRSDLAVIVEENVQSLKDRPPVWKLRYRFKPLGGKEFDPTRHECG